MKLREEVEKIIGINKNVYGAHGIYDMEKVDAILSLFREAIEEAKPKDLVAEELVRNPKDWADRFEGYNRGVSDYHDALKEKMK